MKRTIIAALVACFSLGVCAADWEYDPETKAIGDGVWTFNAELSGTSITVNKILEGGHYPTKISPLDFSKKVVKKGDESTEYGITVISSLFAGYNDSDQIEFYPGREYVGKVTLPGEGFLKLDGLSLYGCVNMSGDIVIPSTVTYIGKGGFKDSKITSVTFGACTATIDGGWDLGPFSGCALLKSVTFPAEGNFTLSGGWVFKNCIWLKEADLSGVVSMATLNETKEDLAHFYGCPALRKLTIGSKLTRFPNNVVLSGQNTALASVRFLGAPPAELGIPFLNEISTSQAVTTIVPSENIDDWKDYADGKKISPEGSATTWAADYVTPGVDLSKRLLVSSTKKPTIDSVSVGETTARSIEVIVDGEKLDGGTVTIVLLKDSAEVGRSVLEDFGGHVFGGLAAGTDYTVSVTAANEYGRTAADPLKTGTYGTTDLAARLYYVKSTQVATFVYDTVDRSRSADIMQFDMGETGGTRGWLDSFSLIDGFNPLTAVFDASFKSFKATNLEKLFCNWKALSKIVGIKNLCTSECTTLASMFYHVDAMTSIDLSCFKTGKVTSMAQMFQWSNKIKTIYANENFTTARVSASQELFGGAASLVGGNGTAYSADHKLVDCAVVDTAETPGYFTYKAYSTGLMVYPR